MSIPVFIDLPINEQVNYAAINGEMLRESILLLYARMESQYVNKVHKNLIIWYRIVVPKRQSEIPSDGFLFDLLEPWDVRALSIRKTADLPLQLWVGTFSRFVAIGREDKRSRRQRYYFLSEQKNPNFHLFHFIRKTPKIYYFVIKNISDKT